MPQADNINGFNRKRPGFTLVEILVAISVFAILSSVMTISLISPQKKASVDSQVLTLISDIKSQQLRSMQGEVGTQSTSQKHGIFIASNKYTIFTGSIYNPAAPDNFDINLEGDLQLSTTFSSSTLLFEKQSGEVTNFLPGQNTITLTSPSGGINKTITVNTYGALTIN